jgi:hypothetical protein
VRVAAVLLGAALVPAPAFGAALTHTSPIAKAAQSESDELSQTPPLQGEDGDQGSGSGSGSNSNGSSSSSSSSASSSTPLPDTGADLPTTALLGLGLLVCGIGLRMRTVDERVF